MMHIYKYTYICIYIYIYIYICVCVCMSVCMYVRTCSGRLRVTLCRLALGVKVLYAWAWKSLYGSPCTRQVYTTLCTHLRLEETKYLHGSLRLKGKDNDVATTNS